MKYFITILMMLFCVSAHAFPVNMFPYADTEFTSGESGIILDLQSDLIAANNGVDTDTNSLAIYNPSNNTIGYQVSTDGVTYDPASILYSCQAFNLSDTNARFIKMLYSGATSGYLITSFTNQSDGQFIPGCVNARLRDADDNLAEFDTVGCGEDGCGYLINISAEHHKIHEGNHFTCQDDDQDVDAVKYYLIKAPDTETRIHYVFNIKSGLNGTVEFFRSPTVTSSGTTLTTYNNDDNSPNTAELLIFEDPTISSTGTARKLVNIIGSDSVSPILSSGGVTSRANEHVLGQGLYYLIAYTPESTNQRISVCSEWYEVE